jgi:hypothetical protein
MSQVADALMSIFGFRRVSATECPATQAIHKARDEAYRRRHAELLDEPAPVVAKPLPAVERLTKS